MKSMEHRRPNQGGAHGKADFMLMFFYHIAQRGTTIVQCGKYVVDVFQIGTARLIHVDRAFGTVKELDAKLPLQADNHAAQRSLGDIKLFGCLRNMFGLRKTAKIFEL